MQTINILTTQNVKIEHELAKVSERFVSFLIDSIAVAILSFVFLYTFTSIITAIDGKLSEFTMFVVSTPFFLFILYHFLFEVLTNGRSIGKLLIGLKVVRLDGSMPTASDYLLRAMFHMIDSFFTITVLGFLFLRVSKNRQRLGDLAAGTTVVSTNTKNRLSLEQIIQLSSLDDYEIQYPQVAKLKEKDMLLIKSALSRYNKYPTAVYKKIIHDLAIQLQKVLDLKVIPKNKISFLKTLLKDYVVLTR